MEREQERELEQEQEREQERELEQEQEREQELEQEQEREQELELEQEREREQERVSGLRHDPMQYQTAFHPHIWVMFRYWPVPAKAAHKRKYSRG